MAGRETLYKEQENKARRPVWGRQDPRMFGFEGQRDLLWRDPYAVEKTLLLKENVPTIFHML